MAGNGRIVMSKQGLDRINLVKNELGITENPLVLKIAFAKGLLHCPGEPEPCSRGGWTIPAGVVARDDDYLLYKHLIINQLGRAIEDQEVDHYLWLYIEAGLKVMEKEIYSLSSLDNYRSKLVSGLA